MSRPWYEIENIGEIHTPALAVYPHRIAENVRRILARVNDDPTRVRLHVKTHKLAEVIRLQLDAGISKFKVATIAEAEMVAAAGARDILLAYTLVGPNMERFAALCARFPDVRFACLVDDPAALASLSAALVAADQSAEVLLDLDNGMHRSGIAPGKAAAAVYRAIQELPGVLPGGLHVYDGHHRQRDFNERVAAVDEAFRPVEDLRDELIAAGLPVPRVVAGGTPTFPVHALHPDREPSPGTCVFWDFGYRDKLPELDFLFAAVLLTRVISRPTPNRVCLDLGYKAIASDNPQPRVELFGYEDAQPVIHNEEHLTLETPQPCTLHVGDVLYGVPVHICPTTALHREVHVIRDNRCDDRWRVAARDRFLTV